MINKVLTFLFVALALWVPSLAFGQALPLEVRDPSIASQNKELGRRAFMTYPKEAFASSGDFTNSIYYRSLDNGKWRFKYFKNSSELPKYYNEPSFNDSAWDTIPAMPKSWDVMGLVGPVAAGDAYSFSKKRPTSTAVPAEGVGIYRTNFVVPYDFDERQIFLNINNIKSGSLIYINGNKAAYIEDSKTRAEIDITKYCAEGLNSLIIETYAISSGSFLEGGNAFRPSGISGNVYIICQPKVRINDFIERVTLDPTYTNGMLEFGVIIKSHYLNPKELKIYYECFDPSGRRISYESKYTKLKNRLQDTVYFNIPIYGVAKWSAEQPNLYSIKVKAQKEDGRYTEFVTTQVGFRTVEVSGTNLVVNGKKIVVKGVVASDIVSENILPGGEAPHLEKTLQQLKSLNVNAILTAHYPLSQRFYELCDKYGFYVISQANIESTGMGQSLSKGGGLANNIKWLNPHIERVSNMYESLKSHPSIVVWSLGYQSGNGYNMYKAYNHIRQRDNVRPIAYDAAKEEWNTDIYFPLNPKLSDIIKWEASADRPCIIETFESQKSFESIWPLVEKGGAISGGFIGDMAELLSVESPKAELVKSTFAPVVAKAIVGDSIEVELKNRNSFISLNNYSISWSVITDGKKTASGKIASSLEPGATQRVTLPIDKTKLKTDKKNRLQIVITEHAPAYLVPSEVVIESSWDL